MRAGRFIVVICSSLMPAKRKLKRAWPNAWTAWVVLTYCVGSIAVAQTAQSASSAAKAATSSDTLAIARTSLLSGDVFTAETSVRDYLAQHSDSADAHFLLGEILFKEKKAKESLAEYTEGAKYRTPGPAELKIVSFDYVLLSDYADADKWLTHAVKEAPSDSEAWYFLGRARYNENRFADAITAFQQCLKLDPKSVKAEDNLGLAYQGLDRINDAIATFQTAIAWQAEAPAKNPDPYVNLGAILIERNQPAEAVKYLEQALAIPSGSFRAQGMAELEPRAREQLAKAYSRLNQLPKAEAELERALETSPQDAHLHYELAQIYQREGKSDKAKGEFDRYTQLGTEKAARNPNR